MYQDVENKITKWMVTEGVISLLFGILLLVWPKATLSLIVYVIAAYLVIAGIVGVVKGVENIGKIGWLVGLAQILLAIFAFIIGIYMFKSPGISLAIFAVWIGIWLIIRGLVFIFAKTIDMNKFWAILTGILSIAAGILFMIKPIAAGTAFVWILGIYAFAFGLVLLISGLVLKNKVS